MVRAPLEGLLHADNPFLVIGGAILRRPDAGSDYEQTRIEILAQGLRFQARRDHTVATHVQRRARPRNHQLVHLSAVTQFLQIAVAQAGEYGHGQDFHIALRARRSFHDGAVAVAKGRLHAGYR